MKLIAKTISRQRYTRLAVLSGVISVSIWSLLTYGGFVPHLFLPSPTDVVFGVVDLFVNYNFAGDILVSIYRILLGFLVSALLAIPIGILLGTSRSIEAFLEPVNDFVRYLPVVAFIPLCILWVGIGNAEKVLVIFIGTYFQLVLLVAAETEKVPKDYIDMALTVGASEKDIIIHVILPAALPGIFDSLRIAMGWAWSYLVVAEIVAAENGIGFTIMQGLRFLKTEHVMAAMLILGFLGLGFDLAFKVTSKILFRWRTEE